MKIDSREVYEDKVDRSQWCECNADKACVVCIDDELYGAVTTTREGDLPAPPPFILFTIDPTPLTLEEERAMHALTHCENEQLCTFCNQ